jgi:hypothetical protein
METFEILALEQHELYDGEITDSNNVLEEFVKFYKRYFINYELPRESILFNSSIMFISYTDKSGGDKPLMLMLIGKLNETLINKIKIEIEKLYEKRNY